MQGPKGLQDDIGLVQEEIRGVAVVGFRQQVGAGVLCRRFAQDAGNGQVFHQPVALFPHVPVEQRPACAPVAVGERMVITEHEMQQDAADDRVDESAIGDRGVGEIAQALQPCFEFFGLGRLVQHGTVAFADHLDVIAPTDPAAVFRVFKRALRQDPLQFDDMGGFEPLAAYFADVAHGLEVVEDHAFADGRRFASFAQHGFRHAPGGRGAFQLARCDGFLDQAGHQVAALVGTNFVRHRPAQDHACFAVDFMEVLQQDFGQGVAERSPEFVLERQRPGIGQAGQFGRQPPTFQIQPFRGGRWRSSSQCR